ncbi:MAG: hypothetical protein AB7H71_07435 [Alphaproteobacteria bacterium]
MRKTALLFVALTAIGLPAMAQSPGAETRVRVVGTVEKLDGDRLSVTTAGGPTQIVTLTPDAAIFGVEKRSVGDIKPGDFVASGGVRGTDGKIHAVDVRIFPEMPRGFSEGQRPWDVKPEGVMTNATVGTVSHTSDGSVVHVTYKGGESEYVVAPDVAVVAYLPADRSLLKPGAAVVTIATKPPDGTLVTSRVYAEKNGVKPPM